jgi:hypothetical protein
MSTYKELVDSTILFLSGYSASQDVSTHLTADLASATATGISVADTSVLSRGLAEIDNELVWIDSTTATGATIAGAGSYPYGRGFRGSTAATHSLGARVTMAPTFPRAAVQRAINETINAVYPTLFAVKETQITFVGAKSAYNLPTGAQKVLSVSWQSVGPTKEWFPVRRWRVDQGAYTGAFASGASLSVYDAIVPGRTMQVVYTAAPATLSADTDDFTTVTGLLPSVEDVVRLGAAYRLVPFLDAPHLAGSAAEADFADSNRPTGSATALGRFFFQLYQARLADEAQTLGNLFPFRSHYTM